MSQIKKLQNGKNVPKPTYGKLTIDAREYEATPELLEALGSYIGGLDPKHQRFLGDVEDALRKGQNISLNTHTNRISGLNGFSELNERQNRRSRRGSSRAGKIIDALTDSDVYQSNEAIALLGGFKYAQQAKENTPALIKVSNTPLNFDYDTKDGKSIYSTNPKNAHIKNRFQYYYDWLDEPDTFKTVYEWSDNPENEDILRSWYADLGEDALSRKNEAKKRIDAALAEVAAADGWDNVSEATRELLGYFNIGNESGATASTPKAETVTRDNWRNPDGSVSDSSAAANGYGIWKGNHRQNENEEDGAYYTSSKLGASTPYMITEGDWDSLGLVGDYEGLRNGIIYKGRIYTPEQIAALTTGDLYNTMNRVRAANDDRSLTGAERWNTIGGLLDWRDEANGYNAYDYNADNQFIKDSALRNLLSGRSNLSFFNAAGRWGFDDGRLLGFYDYSQDTTNPYGFRSPTYIYFNDDGTPEIFTEQQLAEFFPGNKYNRYANYHAFDEGRYFSNQRVNTTQGQMWIYGTAQNSNDPNTPWRVLMDATGNLWLEDPRGSLIAVSPELKAKIDKGEPITRQEASRGTSTSSTRRSAGSSSNPVSSAMEAAARAGVLNRKDGGKLSYIKKLQYGSGIPAYTVSTETTDTYHNPSQDAGKIIQNGKLDLSGLDENDRRDLAAAALDLSGAIAGLVPGGSVVGAGLGLTSTGMMLKSDYERGRLDGKAIGNAALATLLDAASIIPYVGEGPKMIKIAKSVAKVGKTIAPILNAAGFVAAGKTLMKPVKDWNTEDMMALSAGLQAMLNVGHTTARGIGDAALASRIREVKTNNRPTTATEPVVTHKKQMLLSENAPENAGTRQDIVLKKGEVDRITRAGEKSGEELKTILRERKVAESEFANADDKALLKQFGFEVNEKGLLTGGIKGRKDLASASEPKTKKSNPNKGENFQKRGYLTDLFKGANRRQEFIDTNMQDATVREALDASFAQERQSDWTDWVTRRNVRERRAYGEAQYRIGENPHNGEITTRRGFYYGPTEERVTAANEAVVNRQNATPQQSTETPTTQQPTTSPQTTPAPEAPATPQPQVQVAPENPVQSAMRKAYETPAMIDIRERNTGRRAAKLQDTAANIKKLQNSKDPMKTLSELNSKVDKFDEMVFNNQEEFQAALNYALSRMPKNDSNKYKWQNYKDSLTKFLNDNNLVIFTKKGGVLKAQKGLPSLYPGNYSPLNVDKYNVRLPFWTGKAIQKPSPIVVPEIQSPYPQIDKNVDILMGTRSNSGNNSDNSNGFFNIKLPRLSYGTLDQGLGWYQYFRDLRDQDKYLQNQIKGLNASRVQDQAVRENQFTYDNPALDRAEANLRNESVRGFKPMTSDATLYNAQQQQAWGKLLDAQAQLTAQRSAADNQINLQNAEIARRNAMNEVATANQNRRINAAIDAAIFNAQNEHVLRRQQSRENKMLELRNKLMGDKQLAAQIDAENLQKDYQNSLENYYKENFGDLYTQYNNLPANQTKYADFQDYVYQTNPTLWNNKSKGIKDLERNYTNAIQNLALNTRLNFPGLTGLMTRQNRPGSYAYGTSSYKKGGYLRGSTRYTKEPDEQIWIDNNKATHRAIAKLSDNTIKLLLRALK